MSISRRAFSLIELLLATVAVGVLLVLLLRGLSSNPRPIVEKPRAQPERKSPDLIGLVPSPKMFG